MEICSSHVGPDAPASQVENRQSACIICPRDVKPPAFNTEDWSHKSNAMKRMPIIHLNGLPGTGKLTIARILASELNNALSNPRRAQSGTPARAKVLHNHLLIDPANAVLDRTQSGYQKLRKALRDSIFETLVSEPSTYETIYIFTDWQSGDSVGSQVCKDVEAMAQARECQLIPIIVECDEEENLRRLTTGERAVWSKITDADLLRTFRRPRETPLLYEFEGHNARLKIDVTKLSAEQAANMILKHATQRILD